MMILRPHQLVHEFYKVYVKKKYPHLSVKQTTKAVMFPFYFVHQKMRIPELFKMRLKYLGIFKPTLGRSGYLKKRSKDKKLLHVINKYEKLDKLY